MTSQRCTLSPAGDAARAAERHRESVPVLETARLRLRAPRLEDLPSWTRVLCAPAPVGLGAGSAEEAWTEFSSYTACWMLHGHGLWSVETRDTRDLIGFVLVGLEWGDLEPELGYLFLPEARGQGYATEAAQAARDYALTLLGTVVSYVAPDNARSDRLAVRLGAMRDVGAEAAVLSDSGKATHVWRHGGVLE